MPETKNVVDVSDLEDATFTSETVADLVARTKAAGLFPQPPGEVWMLWRLQGDDADSGWAVPLDDPPGGENYLSATSEADALAAAAHQVNNYGVYCIPVRVI